MISVKLVIFDMGNTLLNFHSGKHTDAEKDMFGLEHMKNYFKKNYKIDIPIDKLKKKFLDKWYSDFYIRKDQLVELDVRTYVNDLIKEYGIEFQENESYKLMREFYREYRKEVVVSDSAEVILKELKKSGKNIAIISNCILYDDIYKEIFIDCDLDQYIDKYVFSYSRKIRKPRVELFKEVLDTFDYINDEVVMIGDSYKADIVPAKELGLKTIWLNRKLEKNESYKPDIEIEYFEELSHLFYIIAESKIKGDFK